MRLAAALVGLLFGITVAAPARAAFHLWKINEVFSSADESVQFVELTDSSDFEHQIGGHEVRVREGTTVLDHFEFPGPLGSTDTGGRTLLLATPGFQAVAGVTPDYEIAAGFIDLTRATSVSFDLLDVMPIAGLPTDGRSSLHRNPGSAPTVADATPRNFAGQEGAIDLPEPGPAALGLAAAGALAGLARRARRVPRA